MKLKWILLCIVFSACSKSINKLDTIIPKPVKVEKTGGEFILSQDVYVSSDSAFNSVESYLKEKAISVDINLNGEPKASNGIFLKKLTSANDLGKEGYILNIDKNSITISANEANGAFYAVQTLLQLMTIDSQQTIPCGKITDKPRFAWRGYMLDLARMFYPVESIKKHLDILALHKMNTLHLHLTDDEGGWRIEIKKYPKLTESGAWRENVSSMEPGAEKITNPYGGFYTQDELKDLVEYANQRFITLIPEIEMPGHSAAAIYAYPELSCTGKVNKRDLSKGFEFTDPLCPGNEKTYEFMQDVLSEVMEIFPSQYIHIGGDECKRTTWEKCAKCKNRMMTEGLKTTDELQSYFEKRIETFVISKGRRIIGWDEILEGGLAPEATVMSWRGEEGGIAACKQNHDVIMAPNTYLYFDYYQTDDSKLDPTGMIGTNKLDHVYSYEPLPKQLSAEEAKHILGVQACLWTTVVPNPSDLEVRTLPRLCALSEVAWTPSELKDSADFQKRIFYHYGRLMKFGYGFYIPIPAGATEYSYFTESATVNVSAGIPMAKIYYTMDNSEPSEKSLLYEKPFEVRATSVLKFKTFMPDGKSSPSFTAFYQKAENMDPVRIDKKEPGLNTFHYNGIIESIDTVKNLRSDSNFVINKFRIPEELNNKDYFALIYTGYLLIDQDGEYTFYTSSDDGSALFLNDHLLVNNDGIHGAVVKQGKVPLKKGLYKIQALYFDNHWGQSMKAEYEGPGIPKQEIPADKLFH